ncbi:hypothetical protein TNCV_2123891 [Trichonephila clavipes]|nr:hypothetical protein TNCV_2123891 [Trichonephila clavipes]
MDEDEDNNSNESSNGPSNFECHQSVFCVSQLRSDTSNNQSALLLNYCCAKESRELAGRNEGCTDLYTAWNAFGFGYPNNRVSEQCPVPINSDKRRSTEDRIRYPSQIILPRTYPNGINANSFREPSSIGDYYRSSENNPERYIRFYASHLSP